MVPAPRMATDLPGPTLARMQANSALARGSIKAPSSKLMPLGISWQKSSGWSTNLHRLPCTGGVAKNLTPGSRLYLPCLHRRHFLLTAEMSFLWSSLHLKDRVQACFCVLVSAICQMHELLYSVLLLHDDSRGAPQAILCLRYLVIWTDPTFAFSLYTGHGCTSWESSLQRKR